MHPQRTPGIGFSHAATILSMSELTPSYARQLPGVRAALFCERVIEAKSGILSLINVVDRVIGSFQEDLEPGAVPKIQISLMFVVMVDAVNLEGTHAVTLDLTFPSGRQALSGPVDLTTNFDGKRAQNWMIQINLTTTEQGDHLAVVKFDGEELTRRRLSVLFQQVPTTQTRPVVDSQN